VDDGERRAAADVVRRELFEAAGPLGVRNIKCGAVNHGEPVDRDRLLAEFDRLATDAGQAGTRVALETMRSSDVLPTIRDGADVVRAVGNPHGGLAVDCYHVVRGGTQHAELAEILPPGSAFIVELADGDEAVVGTMFEGEVNQRRSIGEGVFDVPGFIVAMHDLEYDGLWGVEILSEEYRALPVRPALERAHAGAMRAVAAAEKILAARANADTLGR